MLKSKAEVFPDRQLRTETETLPSRVSRGNVKVSVSVIAGSYTACSFWVDLGGISNIPCF